VQVGIISLGSDQSCTKKVKFRPAVHLAFDELELGDLAFGLSVRPWFEKRGG
jgi:hypothetical protein